MNPDLSQLAAYSGEYRQELISELYNAMRLEQEGIAVLPNVKNKVTMHKLLVKEGLKPYTGKFIAGDDINYEPRVLQVESAQRDFEIEPKKYLPTFMAKLRGTGEGANNQTVPFSEFMWNAIMQRNGTELNTNVVFHGRGKAAFSAYVLANTYAVGALVTFTQNSELRYFEAVASVAANESPDAAPTKWKWAGAKAIVKGLGGIITDEIGAGKTVPFATGALDGTNAYDKQMLLYRSLPETVKLGLSGNVMLYQSLTDYEYLMDHYEDKVSKNFETINGITYLAKTEKTVGIRPVSWLAGSRRIIATVEGNLMAGTDQLSDLNDLRSIPQHYTLQTSMTFVIGFQIQDLAVLKVSNQA